MSDIKTTISTKKLIHSLGLFIKPLIMRFDDASPTDQDNINNIKIVISQYTRILLQATNMTDDEFTELLVHYADHDSEEYAFAVFWQKFKVINENILLQTVVTVYSAVACVLQEISKEDPINNNAYKLLIHEMYYDIGLTDINFNNKYLSLSTIMEICATKDPRITMAIIKTLTEKNLQGRDLVNQIQANISILSQ
ncbi:hypothetical protein SAMN04487897_103356 [Paenibacillus sp. yr247]|uniref:hypothetical protein n=1 Tax=Paenibacillus sp. yr247 TaxID=1761880 RepID=UPI00088D5B76|nr:hypothetical protein [Paenibacillus sp. yr247]SDN61847.1 hypothetical protein SAMN04487897_103356 [Paenibacillus sp. yr247]